MAWSDTNFCDEVPCRHRQLDTRNNRDFGGAIIQFVGAG